MLYIKAERLLNNYTGKNGIPQEPMELLLKVRGKF